MRTKNAPCSCGLSDTSVSPRTVERSDRGSRWIRGLLARPPEGTRIAAALSTVSIDDRHAAAGGHTVTSVGLAPASSATTLAQENAQVSVESFTLGVDFAVLIASTVILIVIAARLYPRLAQ